MKKRFATLQQIQNNNNRKITKDTDIEFMYHLEHALLLALKERGILNYMQWKEAERELLKQHRNRARELAQKGVNDK